MKSISYCLAVLDTLPEEFHPRTVLVPPREEDEARNAFDRVAVYHTVEECQALLTQHLVGAECVAVSAASLFMVFNPRPDGTVRTKTLKRDA